MPHPILSGPIIPPPNPLDQFDPNHRDKGAPPWATYCLGRSPKFRTHANRGHALNALHNNAHYGAALYKFEGGRWVEAARFNAARFRPERCEGCNSSLMTQPEKVYDPQTRAYSETGRMLNASSQVFVKERGKIVSPERVVTVCGDCRRAGVFG